MALDALMIPFLQHHLLFEATDVCTEQNDAFVPARHASAIRSCTLMVQGRNVRQHERTYYTLAQTLSDFLQPTFQLAVQLLQSLLKEGKETLKPLHSFLQVAVL